MKDLFEDDPEAAEVFAYELMLRSVLRSGKIEDPEKLWRDEGEEGLLFRKNYRAQAKQFLERLGECGLRVAKSSTPKVTKRLREIQIIPERRAYTLEDELRPKSDPPPQLPG